MIRMKVAVLGLIALGFAPRQASAQSLRTFHGENYAISFTTAWDTVKNNAVIAKYLGLGGMATMTASAGSSLPNLDSLTKTYADTLGGAIKKDSAGMKAIGKYEVHWQKFTYDSLPKLSASIQAATGMNANLKNGSFRVYYLNADGFSFSIACMAIITGGIAPYGDIETALATLKLGTQIGIIPLARGLPRDLWVKDGTLGGGWLKANQVFAVECYDSRGALLGNATHAAEGAWKLPAAKQEMLVRLRTAQGTGLHFLVRP
jgi:hypothetical protein